MSLAQDTGYVLNTVRAQYLSTVDDDQSRRIIRPFPHSFRRQYTKDFNELLTRIDSPPIPVDVMEESELLKRLNERCKLVIDEGNEDDGEHSGDDAHISNQALNKTSFMDSIRSSLATLKFNESKQSAVLSDNNNDSSSSTLPTSSVPQQQPLQMKRQPSVTGKNVLSKLFRNSSSSSTIEKRSNSVTSTIGDDGAFAEDDDDDDDDDDDISMSTNDETMQLAGNETNIELNENADTVMDEEGILVDQNYSDVNNTSNLERFNNSKFLFDDSVSSGDDDLLLDSDFSEDDAVIMDSTYQSGGQIHSLSSRTASRSANRRLSFDKISKSKLKKRSESLGVRRNGDSSVLPHSKSTTNVEQMVHFEKLPVPTAEAHASNLSSLIGKRPNVEGKKATLSGFLFVSGEKISNKKDVMSLKVWLPSEDTIELLVRKSVKVFEVIGFILMNISLKYPEMLADESLQTPNRWCLKLVDDDGEAYEGSFGLLDRTKLFDSFGSEEVALCRVSDSEFEENELRTPYVISANDQSNTPSPSKKQNNYYKSIIPKIDNDVKDAKKVTIQVFVYPFIANVNEYQLFDLLVSDHINDVLLKYTKLNNLDPNDYILKPVREEVILDLNDDISTLDENYQLEILSKRKARVLKLRRRAQFIDSNLPTINSNLTPHTLVMKNNLDDAREEKPQVQVQRSSSKSKFSTSAPKFSSSFKSRNSSKNNFSLKPTDSQFPPSALTGQYVKFTVWRRLPMSFINRHERTLAIDGEYVYIMPNDEKNWYDTNFKNTTFHVSQILNCKVSKRVPANFKIVVMKTNGPKRYVFEAVNAMESKDIVEKLKTLKDAYRINTQSVT